MSAAPHPDEVERMRQRLKAQRDLSFQIFRWQRHADLRMHIYRRAFLKRVRGNPEPPAKITRKLERLWRESPERLRLIESRSRYHKLEQRRAGVRSAIQMCTWSRILELRRRQDTRFLPDLENRFIEQVGLYRPTEQPGLYIRRGTGRIISRDEALRGAEHFAQSFKW